MKYFVLCVLVLIISISVFTQEDETLIVDETLTLVTYDSFAISESVLEQFKLETGITLEILRLSDAGAMVNQSILSRNNPLGDVMYGVDNTFLGRALENDLFLPYEAPLLKNVPQAFQLDAEEFRVTPVAFGDVCLNYDVDYFEANELPLPESLADLTEPIYKEALVVQNPAMSSPGLAFLMTTIAVFGEEGDYTYLDYWRDLVQNDVLVVDSWTQAYYGEFTSGSENGLYPIVVSYASSPPVEVIFSETELTKAPTGAITEDHTCFRQIEFAGILTGTKKIEAAQKFIDFTLGQAFQEDLPLQMFVLPVIKDAELPDVFTEFTEIPGNPVLLDDDVIDTGREDWIKAWTEVVLR